MRSLWLWGSMGLFGDEFSGQRRQPIRQYLNEPCFCEVHIKPLKSLYWEALAGCYRISAFSNSLLSSAGFYCHIQRTPFQRSFCPRKFCGKCVGDLCLLGEKRQFLLFLKSLFFFTFLFYFFFSQDKDILCGH